MIEEGFKTWVIRKKKLGVKSARDVVSRCKRVERVFGISLHSAIRNSNDANQMVKQLTREQSKFFSPSTNKVYALAVLARAVRLYGEFRESE